MRQSPAHNHHQIIDIGWWLPIYTVCILKVPFVKDFCSFDFVRRYYKRQKIYPSGFILIGGTIKFDERLSLLEQRAPELDLIIDQMTPHYQPHLEHVSSQSRSDSCDEIIEKCWNHRRWLRRTSSLFPNGSPLGDPGPHGDLFWVLGPLFMFWVPFFSILE